MGESGQEEHYRSPRKMRLFSLPTQVQAPDLAVRGAALGFMLTTDSTDLLVDHSEVQLQECQFNEKTRHLLICYFS